MFLSCDIDLDNGELEFFFIILTVYIMHTLSWKYKTCMVGRRERDGKLRHRKKE